MSSDICLFVIALWLPEKYINIIINKYSVWTHARETIHHMFLFVVFVNQGFDWSLSGLACYVTYSVLTLLSGSDWD